MGGLRRTRTAAIVGLLLVAACGSVGHELADGGTPAGTTIPPGSATTYCERFAGRIPAQPASSDSATVEVWWTEVRTIAFRARFVASDPISHDVASFEHWARDDATPVYEASGYRTTPVMPARILTARAHIAHYDTVTCGITTHVPA